MEGRLLGLLRYRRSQQRANRSHQRNHRTGQTHRQRLPQPHQLQTPNAPHRRRPRCLHPHSTMKSPTTGPWDDPSREWSTMPVSSRGPRRRRSWWCHTCSSTPSTRAPAKRAGSSDAACRRGLIWDHTVFHVVPHWRARPKIVAPSKRNCRIAQRIARTPKRARGAHTHSSCSRNVTVWQACSRHIQRRLNHRIRTGTRPRAHRSPPPPYDRGLVRSPHNQGSQHSDNRTLCRAPDHAHVERQQPDGSPPNRRADHTDHNDQATQSSSR